MTLANFTCHSIMDNMTVKVFKYNLISKFASENLSRVLGHSVHTQHNVNDIVPVTGDGRNG